jgi:hypothetical protein
MTVAAAKIRPARGPPWVRLVQVAKPVTVAARSQSSAGLSPSQARRYPPRMRKMAAISRIAGTRKRRRSVMSAVTAYSTWPLAARMVALAARSQPSVWWVTAAADWKRLRWLWVSAWLRAPVVLPSMPVGGGERAGGAEGQAQRLAGCRSA